MVSTSQRDTIADDGYNAEVGGGVARGGFASAAVERSGVLVYSFARVSAAVSLRIADYYTQGPRSFFRLHEKGGRCNVVAAHQGSTKIRRVKVADIDG